MTTIIKSFNIPKKIVNIQQQPIINIHVHDDNINEHIHDNDNESVVDVDINIENIENNENIEIPIINNVNIQNNKNSNIINNIIHNNIQIDDNIQEQLYETIKQVLITNCKGNKADGQPCGQTGNFLNAHGYCSKHAKQDTLFNQLPDKIINNKQYIKKNIHQCCALTINSKECNSKVGTFNESILDDGTIIVLCSSHNTKFNSIKKIDIQFNNNAIQKYNEYKTNNINNNNNNDNNDNNNNDNDNNDEQTNNPTKIKNENKNNLIINAINNYFNDVGIVFDTNIIKDNIFHIINPICKHNNCKINSAFIMDVDINGKGYCYAHLPQELKNIHINDKNNKAIAKKEASHLAKLNKTIKSHNKCSAINKNGNNCSSNIGIKNININGNDTFLCATHYKAHNQTQTTNTINLHNTNSISSTNFGF